MSACSGADVAEAGAAAHDVDEDAGHLGADHVGDPLEHQAEAGRGGERHASAGRPPPQPYIMLTVATSLTAWRKTPSSSGQELRHQLGALGRRRDRVAEEVPAAGERARRSPTRTLPLMTSGSPDGSGRRTSGLRLRRADAARRSGLSAPPSTLFAQEAVRLGAGVEAQPARRAALEVQSTGHQPGARVDLAARRDAAVGAGLDAAPAALAVLANQRRPRLVSRGGRHRTSRPRAVQWRCRRRTARNRRTGEAVAPAARRRTRKSRGPARPGRKPCVEIAHAGGQGAANHWHGDWYT